MKTFSYILIIFLTYISLSIAGNEITITNGTSIFIPANAQICADNIIVLTGGSYITEIPEGTCEGAVVSGTGTIALPVELISFTGKWTGKEVILNWSTATEINNLGFSIMKSSDKENWKEISFIKGNGNSISIKQYECTDRSPLGSERIFYKLKQIDINGDSELSELIEINTEIFRYELSQNYPNPFNPSTKIRFTIPNRNLVTGVTNQLVALKVYDILGREVATLINEEKPPGVYEVEFSTNGIGDGTNQFSEVGFLPSGVFFYKLEMGKFSQIKKMILIK